MASNPRRFLRKIQGVCNIFPGLRISSNWRVCRNTSPMTFSGGQQAGSLSGSIGSGGLAAGCPRGLDNKFHTVEPLGGRCTNGSKGRQWKRFGQDPDLLVFSWCKDASMAFMVLPSWVDQSGSGISVASIAQQSLVITDKGFWPSYPAIGFLRASVETHC